MRTGFFRWLLGLKAEAFDFQGWLDTRAIAFPGERDRTSDLVAHLLDLVEHGVPWALLVEFQIVPDPEMFGRVLRHLGSIWQYLWPDEERGSRFCIGAAVINLTGRGKCSQQMRWTGTRLITDLAVVERNLEYERADELLGGVESGMWSRTPLPFIPLMIGGRETDIIDRWKRAAGADTDHQRRGDYSTIALLFAERAGCRAIWDDKLKGWNMTESPFINQFIAQGEAKGRVEGRISTLLDLLNEKFHAVPLDLETAIRGTSELDRLKMWVSTALKANTLAEFRASSGL